MTWMLTSDNDIASVYGVPKTSINLANDGFYTNSQWHAPIILARASLIQNGIERRR